MTIQQEKLEKACDRAKEAVEDLSAIDFSGASAKEVVELFRSARRSTAYLAYLVRIEETRFRQSIDSSVGTESKSPDEVSMAFAERLILLRKQAGLTQIGLAKKCGIPQPQISRYERGKELPSRTSREKLARALDLEVADLIP